MTHFQVLGRQLRDYLSILFLGLFIVFAGMIYCASGTFDLTLTGILATIGTAFAVLRAHGPIKKEYAQARTRDAERRVQLEAGQQLEREHEFGRACIEIAGMMARLSDADLSMFITADQYCETSDEAFRFVTSRGSPIHRVLVALVDVDCCKPIKMHPITPQSDKSLAEYELTAWGRKALELFIRDAFRMREERQNLT